MGGGGYETFFRYRRSYSGNMRSIIIGAGEVGYHIAKALCKTNDVVVIDRDESILERTAALDVQTIRGNGADVKVLIEAGIRNADLVVAVTGIDETNIVASMAAKLIKKGIKTIARVSNPEYMDKPVSSREELGMNAMICPELALASEMYQVLSVPPAISVEDFVGGKVKMMEFKVSKYNPLVGRKLREAEIPEGCVVTAIFRGPELIIPHGDDTILPNDHVIIVGKPEALLEIRKIFGDLLDQRNKILVIGGGVVGFYLINLLRKTNSNLTLIEINKKRCEDIAQQLPNVLILNGDGTDISLLKENDTGLMDAVVSVMNSDEKNLLCSLLAKQLGAKKVIARVDRTEYADLFEMVGVDVAVSKILATVNQVLKFTLGIGIESLVTVEGEKGRIIELTAKKGSRILDKPLRETKFPKSAIISVIVRGEEVIVPGGNDVVHADDKVVIFTLSSAISEVERLFK